MGFYDFYREVKLNSSASLQMLARLFPCFHYFHISEYKENKKRSKETPKNNTNNWYYKYDTQQYNITTGISPSILQ